MFLTHNVGWVERSETQHIDAKALNQSINHVGFRYALPNLRELVKYGPHQGGHCITGYRHSPV